MGTIKFLRDDLKFPDGIHQLFLRTEFNSDIKKVCPLMTNYPSMDKEIFLPAEQVFEQTKPTGLTFDDISLATRYSDVLPSEANLETKLTEQLSLNLPIFSSDMDTVKE